MNPPEAKAITSSLDCLRGLQALDADDGDKLVRQDIRSEVKFNAPCDQFLHLLLLIPQTPLGYHLSCLPLDPRLGKSLLLGAVFQCLDPVLTIAAGLSLRSPFVAPMDKRDEADEAKKRMVCHCSSFCCTLSI